MKKIIPLIFSVLYVITSNAQAVGGWGTCEFATVATMNAFDPSTNAYDCKKVFVQATNEHYYWNGTIWVLVQDTDTDDQNASEVPFTPVGTIVATDVQAAITEIEPDIYGSIGVHSNVDVTTTTPSNGDVLSWDGTNFVPASAGSSDNIYNTDGTIDANREVALGNFDLEFNSTGTGDFFVSDNGTIVFAVEDDNVGIGIASPTKPLHIYESTGTPASATNGTIFLEKGDSGGSQSIVFESNVNAGSDYGYIEYSDDGSGNGSTSENSLLVIGTENDVPGIYQDDIAIMPSGSLGVGTTSPDAFFDVEGGQVRFTDYGIGTYDDASPARILGVQADGDIIEIDPSTLGGSSSSAAFGTIYIADGDDVENNLSEDNPEKVDGTTTLFDATDVDMPTDNRLRYIGTETKTFFVSCNLSARVDANRRQIYYSIRKNDLDIPSINSATHYREDDGSNELNSTTVTGTVELSTNDYIELWVENIEDGSDVTVRFMNLSMFSIEGGGSSGSSDNIYTADGTLGGDRTVDMDGNNITFDGTGDVIIEAGGDVGIGTTTPDARLDVESGTVRFSDYGGGTVTGTLTRVLGVDVDGDVIEVDPSSLGGGGGSGGNTIYSANDNLAGNRTVGLNGNSLTFDGTNDMIIEAGGDVGIGTTSPDARLDVEGGSVRFSDYGVGTYEDTTAIYLLGVEADGDIIEMNTARSSRVFYPPAIAITADVVDTEFELDLHKVYQDLFLDPAVGSTGSPKEIPNYASDELYYYITDYDTDVFENVTIDADGLMEYDVKEAATDDCSFINVVFVVKEP